MLVVDDECWQYYKKHKIRISSKSAEVVFVNNVDDTLDVDDDMFEKITVDVVTVHHEKEDSNEDLKEDEIKIVPDEEEENALCPSCVVAKDYGYSFDLDENEDTQNQSFSTSSSVGKVEIYPFFSSALDIYEYC